MSRHPLLCVLLLAGILGLSAGCGKRSKWSSNQPRFRPSRAPTP